MTPTRQHPQEKLIPTRQLCTILRKAEVNIPSHMLLSMVIGWNLRRMYVPSTTISHDIDLSENFVQPLFMGVPTTGDFPAFPTASPFQTTVPIAREDPLPKKEDRTAEVCQNYLKI